MPHLYNINARHRKHKLPRLWLIRNYSDYYYHDKSFVIGSVSIPVDGCVDSVNHLIMLTDVTNESVYGNAHCNSHNGVH